MIFITPKHDRVWRSVQSHLSKIDYQQGAPPPELPKNDSSTACLQFNDPFQMESIKIGTEAKNGSFTDDGQVDLGVARLRRAEIDPTPVETLVALLDVGDDERGRLAVDAEGGALAEHLVARPVLGGVQVGVSRVHAASKHQSSSFIVKSAILRFINRYIYIHTYMYILSILVYGFVQV